MTYHPPFVLSPQIKPGPAYNPSLQDTHAECEGLAFSSSLSHVGHKVRPSEWPPGTLVLPHHSTMSTTGH